MTAISEQTAFKFGAIQELQNAHTKASFTVGSEAGDAINVGVQLQEAQSGDDVGERRAVLAYLSDDANGDSLAGTAPSGAVAIGTDGVAIELVTKKAWLLISEADGDIDIDINEAGGATWYLAVVAGGQLHVSGAITFAA